MKNFFHNHQNSDFLNEIVFEHRNKSYGAYALRQDYQRDLNKAMMLGILIFGSIAMTPLIISNFSSKQNKAVEDSTKFRLHPVDIKDPVTKLPVKTRNSAKESTVKITVPTPTANPPVETTATPITKINEAKIGVQDISGIPPSTKYNPPVISSTTIPSLPVTPPSAKEDNGVKTSVDIEATFSQGIDIFRERVVKNFDTFNFSDSEEVLSTTVTFIVEKDGTISQVTAKGNHSDFNKEAEKTIRSIKGQWTPAKINGQPVRSYFTFPISMRFQ